MSRHPLLSASALLVALTVLVTWPQALYLGTRVAAHDDALFSIWRLAWVAHAVPTDPRHIFDANIFYPHVRTLAYSDAMLFEALLAAPWLWAHANPVLVYNVLLLAGIVSSGIGMFVLARYLTADVDAALVSAVVFTLVPYRIEHFMHLELQWTVWMPLSLWAVHRTLEQGSWRLGMLAGLLLWLQLVSCLYYGAFLGIIMAALAVLLSLAQPRQARCAIGPLLLGALVAGALTLPYAMPYIENARLLGSRDVGEVARFSARLSSYAVAPQQNWLWGWTAVRLAGNELTGNALAGNELTGNELHLFPGVAAIGLGLLAFARRPARGHVLTYLALAALAVVLSLGSHGVLYGWLQSHVWAFRAFRAPARFSILACCALAVLAGFGFQALRQLVAARPIRRALLATVLVVIAVECGSAPMALAEVHRGVPDIYKRLRTLDRTVIVEFPMVDYDLTPLFMYGSIFHWHQLVNGYSGYAPPDYLETRARMRTFPDDEAVARLRELGVRYVLLHQAYYTPDQYKDLMNRVLRRSELIPNGHFRDWLGSTELFELKRPAESASPPTPR